VHLADGETGTGARVALAASLGQVPGLIVDLGSDDGRDVVPHHGSSRSWRRSAIRPWRPAVVGGIEAHQAVRRKAELAGQADVAVATSASVADVRRVHRGSFVGVFENPVLAVAVGAQRRLRDAARQRLPMHAGSILPAISLWHMPQVSGTAARNACELGDSSFVRASVAHATVGAPSFPFLRAWPCTPSA